MKAEVFTSAFSFILFASEGSLRDPWLNLSLKFIARPTHSVRICNPERSNARKTIEID
jgi:hypothetical protein